MRRQATSFDDQIRIDVPLRTTCAYMFVDVEAAMRRSAWWRSLYDHVLGLLPRDAHWKYGPVQNVWVCAARGDRR